jgi:hypothetical protein
MNSTAGKTVVFAGSGIWGYGVELAQLREKGRERAV